MRRFHVLAVAAIGLLLWAAAAFVQHPSSEPVRWQLALAIADAKNPLTARVLVNRLWQHHFGRGIVPTPSDFGHTGLPPTHPELLDWLAVELMEHGWSMKHLHRLIVLSNTYRMQNVAAGSGGEPPALAALA